MKHNRYLDVVESALANDIKTYQHPQPTLNSKLVIYCSGEGVFTSSVASRDLRDINWFSSS
jgi:hypothetical protein